MDSLINLEHSDQPQPIWSAESEPVQRILIWNVRSWPLNTGYQTGGEERQV